MFTRSAWTASSRGVSGSVSRASRTRMSTSMAQRNYFNALAGLKLDDSPSNSPTAAAAASKRAAKKAAALSSSDKAEDLRKGGIQPNQQKRQQENQQPTPPDEPAAQQQQQHEEQQAEASSSGDTAAADGPSSSTADKKHSSSNGGDKPKKVPSALVWIDLEMTGLEPEKDTIIEIACLITNADLTRVWEGPDIAIHHPESVLDKMNDWCKEHHHKSGLVQRVRDSKVSLREAEQQVLAFVQQHTEFGAAQLAGNSIHVDRVFLQRYMPELVAHLHYRIVDVSTLKELCRRWRPKLYKQAPRKVGAHTAMSDIKESLTELRYYKKCLFGGK